MRPLFYLLICFVLSGCLATAPEPSQKTPEERAGQLKAALLAIPGVVVPEGEPLRALFPVGSLFTKGSVLPLAGGVSSLDVLVGVFKTSQTDWQLTLRAASGGEKAYDQRLAKVRVAVLQTYFKDQGLNLRRLRFVVRAETGPSLEIAQRQKR